jgi:glyoxylase-like metal-dependent hydrolase (beta-lactamase superfamily II)
MRRAEATGGGPLPPMGSPAQRTSAWLQGAHAWNVAGTSIAPLPEEVDARVHDLWTTPHGVVKAALRNVADLRTEGEFSVVGFMEANRFRAAVWIGPDGFVHRVDSVMPHPVTGDTPVTALYGAWRDFGGLKFPTRIVKYAGGFPVLDLMVDEVQGGAPVHIETPAAVRDFREEVAVERMTDGVWFLGGRSPGSVLVEFDDHLMLVECPLGEGRAHAVIDAVRRIVPGKKLAFVVNTHHHFECAGGLRTAAAEGATLVVSEQARPWFERTFARANAVKPDALAKSGRKPVFVGVNGQRIFRDAMREADLFMIEDSGHAQGLMMAWLPGERLLVETDAYTPGPTHASASPDAADRNLVANIERLHLDVDRIVPLHGRIVPAAALYGAVAKQP